MSEVFVTNKLRRIRTGEKIANFSELEFDVSDLSAEDLALLKTAAAEEGQAYTAYSIHDEADGDRPTGGVTTNGSLTTPPTSADATVTYTSSLPIDRNQNIYQTIGLQIGERNIIWSHAVLWNVALPDHLATDTELAMSIATAIANIPADPNDTTVYKGVWDSTVTYNIGDMVSFFHNSVNRIYISKRENNLNNSPEGEEWSEVGIIKTIVDDGIAGSRLLPNISGGNANVIIATPVILINFRNDRFGSLRYPGLEREDGSVRHSYIVPTGNIVINNAGLIFIGDGIQELRRYIRIDNNAEPPVITVDALHFNRSAGLPTTQSGIEQGTRVLLPESGTVEASFAAGTDGDFIWAALPTSRTVLRIYNRDFPLDDILIAATLQVVGIYNLYHIANVRASANNVWEIVL